MCLHGALCSIPFNLIGSMTIFSKNILTPPQLLRGCVRTEDRKYACMVLEAEFHLFDMQHDYFKKKCFDL